MRRRAGQQGFVLVATLALLAVITIAATYFAERVGEAVRLVGQSQDIAQALIEMESSRAEVLFRLNTQHMSFYGLGLEPDSRVALDGRVYRAIGGSRVAVQDLTGLLNVNFPQDVLLTRLLGEFGVEATQYGRLLDTLRDYTDVDDLHRLNGAEREDYLQQGLPPPPNDLLTVVDQLPLILGWREQTVLWRNRHFLDLLSTTRNGLLNINTAPVEVLAALPGSDMDLAREIVRIREQNPLHSVADLGALAGRLSGDLMEWLIFFPGDSVRIIISHPNVPWAFRSELTLTPTSPDAPWRIDTATIAPRGETSQGDAPILPPLQYLNAPPAP
jgi:general secretion pathway protein K